MTYFPAQARPRPAVLTAAALASMRATIQRDILWNQPIFRAPRLPSPRLALEPLPFRATRITQRSGRA